MAAYTVQKLFSWRRPNSPAVVTVQITSGTVVVEKPVGNSWVTAYTFSETGCQALWLGRGKYRITPNGTATYEVDDQ